MTSIIGALLGSALTSAEATTEGKGFSLGDRFTDHAGKEYVFITAGGTIAQYDVVVFDEAYSATALSTSNDARGDLVGVAPVAFTSGQYGFVQVKGPCTMNVLASCAANVRLNTTGTAGSLDDDGTSTSIQVEGIYLTTARGGSNGSAAGILNYPIQGVTL